MDANLLAIGFAIILTIYLDMRMRTRQQNRQKALIKRLNDMSKINKV